MVKSISNGYEIEYDPGDPSAYANGVVYIHRQVMSQALGRPLTREEHIHHINGNCLDNRLKNLMLVSNSEHAKIHSDSSKQAHPCAWCGEDTLNKKYCSGKCSGLDHRKVTERPSIKALLEELKTQSFCALGIKYGVSDNAVRKWIKPGA